MHNAKRCARLSYCENIQSCWTVYSVGCGRGVFFCVFVDNVRLWKQKVSMPARKQQFAGWLNICVTIGSDLFVGLLTGGRVAMWYSQVHRLMSRRSRESLRMCDSHMEALTDWRVELLSVVCWNFRFVGIEKLKVSSSFRIFLAVMNGYLFFQSWRQRAVNCH